MKNNCAEVEALKSKIETVRSHLYEVSGKNAENVASSETLKMSQTLDLLIIEYMKRKNCG